MTDHDEVFFDPSEIIVSKTDLKGKIIYANDVFRRVSGHGEAELLGRQHNIIRHADMPRAVFKLLWNRLRQEEEVFAFVKNAARDGRHYWVFAHVTPSFDAAGAMIGYHSSRRTVNRRALPVIGELYAVLRNIEKQAASPKQGLADAERHLSRLLAEKQMDYDEFVFSLESMT